MRYLPLLLFALIVSSCKNKNSYDSAEGEKLPKDFIEFYEKFHKDTAFQKAHCIFPMQGLPDQADSTVNASTFRWTESNWNYHKELNLPPSFHREFSTFGPEMIIERILDDKQGIGMERRWVKFGKEWSLFYYVGMNQFSKNKKG